MPLCHYRHLNYDIQVKWHKENSRHAAQSCTERERARGTSNATTMTLDLPLLCCQYSGRLMHNAVVLSVAHQCIRARCRIAGGQRPSAPNRFGHDLLVQRRPFINYGGTALDKGSLERVDSYNIRPMSPLMEGIMAGCQVHGVQRSAQLSRRNHGATLQARTNCQHLQFSSPFTSPSN